VQGFRSKAQIDHEQPVARALDRILGRPWLAWAVLCVSAGLFLGLWHVLSIDYAQRANARFELRAKVLHAELSERMQDYLRVLDGGVGLFGASEQVSRGEWHDYIRALRLEKTRPGILRDWFRADGRSGRAGAPRGAGPGRGLSRLLDSSPGNRPVFSSIIYLEPFSAANRRAFGYDMFSEPVRRAAMERARDTGEPAMSGKVILVQEGKGADQPGFLIYQPIYRNGAPVDSIEARRAALLGFVYSPFRAQDVIGHIFKSSVADLELEVFDGPGRPESLLHIGARSARGTPRAGDGDRHRRPFLAPAHPQQRRIRGSVPRCAAAVDAAGRHDLLADAVRPHPHAGAARSPDGGNRARPGAWP
jgi:CHASE1-domain containing sensor protein